MRRSSAFLALLVGLLWLPTIWGCAATPLPVVKAEAGVNFQRYTTLVVKDFQNGVGDALPPRVLQELPEAVMAHLNECYPGAPSARSIGRPLARPRSWSSGGPSPNIGKAVGLRGPCSSAWGAQILRVMSRSWMGRAADNSLRPRWTCCGRWEDWSAPRSGSRT